MKIRLSLEHREKNLVKTNELVILIQSIISPGRAATIKSKFFTDKSDNDTLIYDTKEKAVEIFQAALAHPTKEITDQNIISTFFTPFEQNTQPYTYANLLEKFAIISPKNENISQSPKITLVSTNHPYNILRYLGTYPKQTTRNQFNTTKLFGCIGRYLQAYVSNEISNGGANQNSELNKKLLAELSTLFQEEKDISIFAEKKIQIENKLKEMKEKELRVEDKNILRLLDASQAYLTIPPGQGSILQEDKQHRQSMLSALEVIIVHCLQGTSWVACKSGKDRTGGAAAAIDANDGQKERTHYLNIWDKLLQSGHHQNIASCNSPGAKGLVNGAGFLPGDMRRNQDRQKKETQFARLNKPNVKNIYKNLNKKIKKFINLIKKLIYLEKNITNLFYDKELTIKEMPSKGQETIKEFIEKLQPLKINDIKTVECDKGSDQNSKYLTYSIGSLRFFYLRQKNTSQNTVQKKEAEKIESRLSPLNA
ncbi:hypothetical protein [Rickettsiella massiliensis]|uniref:hypothetical protein n=1 Tax=Rickettsiella massiliensis TaxID=676517 RepID=UPI00029B16F3|nr:hypothetical protein [Rickettsiella massiliensis]